MRIYLASSWKNEFHEDMLQMLFAFDFDVYDYRNPAPGIRGFSWDEMDPKWRDWSDRQYIEAMGGKRPVEAYCRDASALLDADAVVALAPFGASVGVEVGIACGKSIPVAVFLTGKKVSPELMTMAVDMMTPDANFLVRWLIAIRNRYSPRRRCPFCGHVPPPYENKIASRHFADCYRIDQTDPSDKSDRSDQ